MAKASWNKEADVYNQWDNISCDEKLEYTVQYILDHPELVEGKTK